MTARSPWAVAPGKPVVSARELAGWAVAGTATAEDERRRQRPSSSR